MRKQVGVFQDMESMQREMERLFSDMWGRHAAGMLSARETWRPPTDVYETPSGLVVKMEVANMRDRDIEVILEGKSLTVSGSRPDDRHSERISYYQMGINYGPFCMQIFLPWPVEEDAVTASYEDGFLKIRLPRRAHDTTETRRVEIKVGEKE